jgi:hypothetical protein
MKRASGKREERKQLLALVQLAGLTEAADEQKKLDRKFESHVRYIRLG